MLDKFKLKNVKFALFPKSKLQGVDGNKSANSSISDLSKKFSDFFSSKISKINKIEERILKGYKEQLKKTKDKDTREQLLELINLYEPKVEIEKVEETVVPNIVKESAIKKPKEKTKELFVFKTAEPYRKDYSRLVYWCNPFEPINKGKLGTTQSWRKEERFKKYY
jgi:hypothetical protein